jgi:hypothetical protein
LSGLGDAFCGECRGDLSEAPMPNDPSLLIDTPPSLEEFKSDREFAVSMAICMTAILTVMIVFPLFVHSSRDEFARVFGKEPLGVPVLLFVGVLQGILTIPFPRAFFHYALILRQAFREKKYLVGAVRALFFIAGIGERHPHLAKSQRICFWTFGYFIAIVAVWTLLTWNPIRDG